MEASLRTPLGPVVGYGPNSLTPLLLQQIPNFFLNFSFHKSHVVGFRVEHKPKTKFSSQNTTLFNRFSKTLSSTTWNICSSLLFLLKSSSSALKDCYILGNQNPKDNVLYTPQLILFSPICYSFYRFTVNP